jgi:hypothetical protein
MDSGAAPGALAEPCEAHIPPYETWIFEKDSNLSSGSFSIFLELAVCCPYILPPGGFRFHHPYHLSYSRR